MDNHVNFAGNTATAGSFNELGYREMSLEQRIDEAREANIALYRMDPSPKSAMLLVVFERAVKQRRLRKPQAATESETTSGDGGEAE